MAETVTVRVAPPETVTIVETVVFPLGMEEDVVLLDVGGEDVGGGLDLNGQWN